MTKKLSLLTVMLLASIMILTGCGGSNDGEDTFKVGLECGYPPFNWTQMDDSNGAVKISGNAEYAGGYDVEMAKKIADGLGKELEIVKIEWDGLVPALTSGKIDAIMAGMSPTAKRKETIDFSNDYYKSDLVMVVKNGSKYVGASSIKDFEGAKITGQLNTFHYSVIDQIKGVAKQPAMDNFTAMRVALEAGMIDGYVSERPEGVSAAAANPNLKMVELKEGFKTSEEDTSIAVGLPKGSKLASKINEILKDIPERDRMDIMDNAIINQPSSK